MHRHLSLVVLSLCSCLGAMACGRQDLVGVDGEDDKQPSWSVGDRALGMDELPPLEGSPLVGEWSGPQTIGGCVSSGSWRSFAPDGRFEQVDFDANPCEPEERRYVVPCVGTWELFSAEPDLGRYGQLLSACSVDEGDVHPRQPKERYHERTFAIFYDGSERLTLSDRAFIWDETSGEIARHEVLETTYPPSETFDVDERLFTTTTTTFKLYEPTAVVAQDEPIKSVDAFGEGVLSGKESKPYLLIIEIKAQGSFSSFGGSESGTERFQVPVEVRGDERGLVELRLRIEGSSDLLAWTEYVQGKGVNQRYVALGSVFGLSFSRVLKLDVASPRAWAIPGPWLHIEDICEGYGGALSERCAEGG